MAVFLAGRQRVKGRKQQVMLGLSDISIFPTSAFIISYLGMQGNLSNLTLPAWKRSSRKSRLQQRLGRFSGMCWSPLAVAAGADCAHLFSALCSVMSCWELEIGHDGVFTPWKSADATYQSGIFFPPGELVYQLITALCP